MSWNNRGQHNYNQRGGFGGRQSFNIKYRGNQQHRYDEGDPPSSPGQGAPPPYEPSNARQPVHRVQRMEPLRRESDTWEHQTQQRDTAPNQDFRRQQHQQQQHQHQQRHVYRRGGQADQPPPPPGRWHDDDGQQPLPEGNRHGQQQQERVKERERRERDQQGEQHRQAKRPRVASPGSPKQPETPPQTADSNGRLKPLPVQTPQRQQVTEALPPQQQQQQQYRRNGNDRRPQNLQQARTRSPQPSSSTAAQKQRPNFTQSDSEAMRTGHLEVTGRTLRGSDWAALLKLWDQPSELPGLLEVSIKDCFLEEGWGLLLSLLWKAPNLSRVVFQETHILSESFSAEQLISRCGSFAFNNCNLPDKAWLCALMAHASSISFRNTKMTLAELVGVTNRLPNIRHLDLSASIRLHAVALDTVNRMFARRWNKLLSLNLSGCDLSTADVPFWKTLLDAMPRLAELVVNNCRLQGTCIENVAKAIAECGCKLTKLSAQYNGISSSGLNNALEQLSRTRLVVLDLEGNDIDHLFAEGCSALSANKTLRALHLRGNPILKKQDICETINGLLQRKWSIDDHHQFTEVFQENAVFMLMAAKKLDPFAAQHRRNHPSRGQTRAEKATDSAQFVIEHILPYAQLRGNWKLYDSVHSPSWYTPLSA
eukprot:TRINITY_DN124_c4_g1_i1.p1 TRINITY_DN124_c4_g1~~TRINITY_DN124_c4_g1_i1.p1  ORF type:complete len:661 (+),score=137.46 TRINITY_DN124_c4_g1_i1:30-1985(+)